jgi:hypothetical protein
MNTINVSSSVRNILLVIFAMTLAACATKPPACASPQTRNLDAAVGLVQRSLNNGCAVHFERFYDDLLTIAEGDPKPENKRIFSEFLVWSADQGLISQRQAKEHYNRFFNVKFVSLESDYNNCSHTCPRRDSVMRQMERELSDKERGLMRVSLDNSGYYRSDELYQEVELVLEATCTACEAGN